MRSRLILLFIVILAPAAVHAQSASVRGRFVDAVSRSPVDGVLLKLTDLSDSTRVHQATSSDSGTFQVAGLAVGGYRLVATRLGYAPLRTVLRVTNENQDAGLLQMTSEAVHIGGVTVTESPPVATQKGDTTEFRAGALETHRDATAEELVQKLPGVTVEGGQVRAQGEAVQQVLVNGRPFMGNDPTAAMRNLPAEVIDRIQVYDRASDGAELSGFDDGQSQKTMNFILRDQNLRFGKTYAGYGDDDRYQAGGNATFIRGATRLTMLGLSNNINQRNFSQQDLFGAMSGTSGGGRRGGGGGRRGGGGDGGQQVVRMGGGFGSGGGFDPGSFLVNSEGGVTTTHSGGANYVGQWGPKLSVSSSVFVNASDNDNLQLLSRQFMPPQDSVAFYDQITNGTNRNRNQRVDARFEWTPDSVNSVVFQPRLYFQNSRKAGYGGGSNSSLAGEPLNVATSENASETAGNNLSARLTLRHRFAKRGRNASAEINAGHTDRDQDTGQYALTESRTGTTVASDTLDQRSLGESFTNSFSTRISVTEPVHPRLRIQLNYSPSVSWSESDTRAHRYNPLTAGYDLPDTAASSTHQSRNTVQNAGASALFTSGPWRVQAGGAYQRSDLLSEQTFPMETPIERTFRNVLPTVTLTGNFANRRNLRLVWRTSTTAPTIHQLQSVVDNTNPLSLSTGNPDLSQSYSHTLSLRLSEANPAKSTSRFLFGNITRTSQPIANATFFAPADTTLDGIFVPRGGQLTRPENLDESWNGSVFGVYARPVVKLKSNLSLSAGVTHTRTPTRVNSGINVGRTTTVRPGLNLSSNISPQLDFTLSYQGAMNYARNAATDDDTGDYYSHALSLQLNVVVGPGIVVRQDLVHNLQGNTAPVYGEDALMWNWTIGKKFLKDQRGELRVTTTDALENERSVNRSITETFVQDTRDRVLGRFVQAVFTYSWR
jgi:Outer membrane protein beta-barrel family/Carboxypeptidase regulatory-like domain